MPSGLVEVVRRYLQHGEAAEAVLAEISAVNAELLARRELGETVAAAGLDGSARAEAVAVLANMTISVLEHG